MTEKRCNYTGTYFRFLLGKLRPCIILSLIFSVCSFPMIAIGENTNDITTKALIMSLSILGVAGIIVMSFITPLITMKHLYTKTSADNILSLPLTAWQRYICETSSALAAYALPYLPAMLFTVFYVKAFYSSATAELPAISVQAMLFMLSFSMFNILLTCFCGRLAEAILYPVALGILIPLFTYFVVTLSHSNMYGVQTFTLSDYSLATTVLMSITSPTGCAFYHIVMQPVMGDPWAIVPPVVMLIVYFIAAFPIYKKRPAHNIGQPFVFRQAYTVNSVCIAFFSTMIFISFMVMWTEKLPSGTAYVIWAVILLILTLVMELINYKKIKSLPKFIIRYAGAFAGAFVLSLGLYYSEGLGETRYIPSANETAYISVNAMFSATPVDAKNGWYGRWNINDEISIDIKDGTETAGYIRDIHKNIVNKRTENGYAILNLVYKLKNGATVSRNYYGCELPNNFIETVANTEEYRISDITHIDWEIENNGREQYSAEGDYYYVDYAGMPAPEVVRVLAPVTEVTLFDGNIDYYDIRDALYKDLINDTEYERHSEMPVCVIKLGQYIEWEGPDEQGNIIKRTDFSTHYPCDLKIYGSYTNTLAYLKKFGEIPSAEALIDKLLSEKDYPLVLSRVRLTDSGQTVRMPRCNVHYLLTDDESESYSAVIISREEFLEAAQYDAEYLEKDGDYVYMLTISLPSLLYPRNNTDGLSEQVIEQLRESGIIDKDWFVQVTNYEGDDIITVNNDYYNSALVYLSEKYNATAEKIFSDGRYVYRNVK